jgi:general secretion pathway protein B
MSFILDALRKAERDRNLGKTPTLGDVAPPPARPAAPSAITTRTLALLALVVGLLILAVLLWPRDSAPPLPPAVQVLPPVAAPAPAALPQALPDPAPAPVAAGEPALDEDVVAETLDDLLEPVDEEIAVVEDEAIEDSAPPAMASTAEPVAVVSDVAEPAATTGAMLLRDMPADYRGAFPAIRVDVHVYNEEPARRWVMINGNKAIEGATLAEGPRVAEITPDGIVFDFRGRTALFPLKR